MNLTRWKELERKATEGEWVVFEDGPRGATLEILDSKGYRKANAIVHWSGFDASEKTYREKNANAHLIALLRNISPALLKVVEASKKYADNYLRDELAEPGLCVSEEHHQDVVALFDALDELAEKMEKPHDPR